MLVVWSQQTNSSTPHAGVPEVAKRARRDAPQAKLRKADNQLEKRLDGHGDLVQGRGYDSCPPIHRNHRSGQEAGKQHKKGRLVGRRSARPERRRG
jgi:hypothetical protein